MFLKMTGAIGGGTTAPLVVRPCTTLLEMTGVIGGGATAPLVAGWCTTRLIMTGPILAEGQQRLWWLVGTTSGH